MGGLGRRVSYYRHLSELWALSLAMRAPYLAILPIGMVVVFWWVFASTPIVLPALMLIENFGPVNGVFVGVLMLVVLLLGPVVLLLAAPWYVGWYRIAVGLMFGRPASAIAKQRVLVDAIRADGAKIG